MVTIMININDKTWRFSVHAKDIDWKLKFRWIRSSNHMTSHGKIHSSLCYQYYYKYLWKFSWIIDKTQTKTIGLRKSFVETQQRKLVRPSIRWYFSYSQVRSSKKTKFLRNVGIRILQSVCLHCGCMFNSGG